jgi:hypothetical protein
MNPTVLLAAATAAVLLGAPASALDNPILIRLAGPAPGTVTLFQADASVLVNVELGARTLQGAAVAIVDGTCADPGPGAYALTESVNGQSQTQVPGASVAALVARPHAIVVRKNAHPGAPILACGNIRG